ncbi:hypothetical protein TTHT_0025 [Thermotomaculum hydrothermale]|uniref:Tetratricopeptide repeat protein n=1 Tax=Thermotomaculum hydrothermale TaxID=981385 RepID=A0A7R6SXD9_9BACT|nr:glycosyltransferase family 39 protein [Thermotomaculum hydrothermale]BBB31679.1 hypothetical protein TTHT_0025 [Thermotomaculum hydrothermale]
MKKKYFLFAFVLLILVFFGFWDVIQNPQVYYDDINNIFNLTIASKTFNLETIKKVLIFHFGGFRPVSYFSFYLNYLFWGRGTENLFPFIITNVIIHFFNSLLVFFVSMKLTKDNYRISFFVSILWALSPVNSLAVDYIVQRMTELMFFFGMLSFYCFLKYLEKRKKAFLLLTAVFFVLSVLSKENGVLFLPLFFVYLVWFDFLKIDIKKLYLLFILLYVLFLVFAANYFYPQAIVRGFTPWERFLTESRILLFYLKTLLLPLPSDIFLYVDFSVSRNLFHPFSTFVSSLLLILLFFASLYLYKKDRLISFGILGFFIFHSIEASTIPLYIAFLHRNYAPSFFLYFAMVSFFFKYVRRDFFRYTVLFSIACVFVFVLKIHNSSYSSPFYYLSQNYKSFPNNKDLCAALGIRYSKTGQYKKALDLYIKSFKPDKLENRIELVLGAFFNMGCYQCVINMRGLVKGAVIYQIIGKSYKKMNKFNKAEQYFKESLKIEFSKNTLFSYLDLLAKQGRFKDILVLINRYEKKIGQFELTYMYKINSYIELGEFEKAKPLFDKLTSKKVYLWLKGKYFLRKGKISEAIETLNKIEIKVLSPPNVFIQLQKVLLLSDAYEKAGEYDKALNLLKDYSKKGFFKDIIEKQIETIKRDREKNGKALPE